MEFRFKILAGWLSTRATAVATAIGLLSGPFAQAVEVTHVGHWPVWPKASANAVALSGRYAYVADGEAGLHVIDVANPAEPVRVGGHDTSGTASGVAVSGRYAYVADGETGLEVIDVSNPVNPVRLGGYVTREAALHLAVSGRYAYVAIGDAGLEIVDVGDPVTA